MRVLDDVDRLLRPAELIRDAGLGPDRRDAALAAAVAIGQLIRRGRCYGLPGGRDRVPAIGAAVKYVRGLAGLTQAAASERAGMSQAQWAALEKGRHDPRVTTLRRAARALGCRAYHLLPG